MNRSYFLPWYLTSPYKRDGDRGTYSDRDHLRKETYIQPYLLVTSLTLSFLFQIPGAPDDEAVRIFLEFERVESAIKGQLYNPM